MENSVVKGQKVIWSREFPQFSSDLEKALYDGWLVVPKTLVVMVMPEGRDSHGGERYLVIVEK